MTINFWIFKSKGSPVRFLSSKKSVPGDAQLAQEYGYMSPLQKKTYRRCRLDSIFVVGVSMMCRLIKKESLDRSETMEDSFGSLNSFIREDKIFWVFWGDLEKPGLNCWAAEDMLGRPLNIRVV
ncbi:hypothetical protein TNCV_4472811 [Trichonephila clavipes]|uniref:Uncharacterized protein n=1 Tax=Trichonephila clavipes TaxID=2585209 RepID=A0A8X6SQS5_TRICX|nr:hypothetical protein TNCV_4472811 [Trichonephila clavipes]